MIVTALRSDDIEADVLSQWDTGVRIQVSECDFPAAYAVEYIFNGQVLHTEADPIGYDIDTLSLFFYLPDRILQRTGILTVHVHAAVIGLSRTECTQNFVIVPREKPQGYIYTPVESQNYLALLGRVAALERVMDGSAVTQFQQIKEEITAKISDFQTLLDGSADTLDAINQILSDLEYLENNTRRAVSASQEAELAYERLDAYRAELKGYVATAEAAAASAGQSNSYAYELQGRLENTLNSFNALKSSYDSALTGCNDALDQALKAVEDARAYAAQTAKNPVVICAAVQNCTFSTKGTFVDVSFSDYGLSFSKPPVVICPNPFTDENSVAAAMSITATGFVIYLKHSYNSGTQSVPFLVVVNPDDTN